jgi:hypothetical protein
MNGMNQKRRPKQALQIYRLRTRYELGPAHAKSTSRGEDEMRPRSLITIGITLTTLTYQAFAGKKVEFNATVRADISCELGYRITHLDKKNGEKNYCAIGPKAAAPYLEKNLDRQVNIKGHDGIQTHDGNQIVVLWIDRIGGRKVKDYDPCHISTAFAITAGLAGQIPQLPPECTGGVASSQPDSGTGDQPQSAAPPSESNEPSISNGALGTEAQQAPTPSSTPSESEAQGATVSSANRYVSGVPQCTVTQMDPQFSTLWIVNKCNIAVAVMWTSDSGNSWGMVNIQGGNRAMVSQSGIGYTRKDGRVYLFTCPINTTPVLPNGNGIWSRTYKGEYTCQMP